MSHLQLAVVRHEIASTVQHSVSGCVPARQFEVQVP